MEGENNDTKPRPRVVGVKFYFQKYKLGFVIDRYNRDKMGSKTCELGLFAP